MIEAGPYSTSFLSRIRFFACEKPLPVLVSGVVFAVLLSFSAPVMAAAGTRDGDPPIPPSLTALERAQPSSSFRKKTDGKGGLPFDIRKNALQEAALSYGARGGLSARTYEIRRELDATSSYLDKVFDFAQLLIPAQSGLLIEPPIISADENAMIIDAGGQEAAVADRIYNISVNARIVSAPRLWQNYLERDWGEVMPPPDILLPENREERELWVEYVREGWKTGVEQANEIFQDDLLQLTADYQGMVRYRMLLSQNMVSPPYAMQVDRGVTGGGNTMRVGDRAVQITGRPVLKPGAYQWQPANR